MPIYTTLEFFRTKQSIDSFVIKYPKSIAGLHEAIRESLDKVDDMIKELSFQYLDGFESQESFIRDKMISISLLLSETQISGIYKRFDFENLCDMAGSSRDLNTHIAKVKNVCQDIVNYNPNLFSLILDLIEKIINCMDKYLRSFLVGSVHDQHHKFMDTCVKYEKKRWEIMQYIKEKLHNMFNLANNFNYSGIKMEDLSERTVQLGWKTKCTLAPGLLLFSENCFLIEECKQMLLDWIELDRDYLKNIKTDIETVQYLKNNLEIKRRNDFDEYIRQRHRYEYMNIAYEKEFDTRSSVERKLSKYETDESRLLVEMKHNDIELASAEMSIKNMKREMELEGRSTELVVALTRLTSKVDSVTQKRKTYKSKLDNIESRIENYKKFLNQLVKDKISIDKMRKQVEELRKTVNKDDAELDEINGNLNQLQTIATLKSSNVTLKKIFYNLDLGNKMQFLMEKNPQEATETSQDLTTAIKITSQMIGKEWCKLYFNLPFHPPRGNKEIEDDISKITKFQVRGLFPDLALQSLNRWRTLHTRTNINCLVTALRSIKRSDIVDAISESVSEELKTIPTNAIIRHTVDDKSPPVSATTRFLYHHYPHLKEDNQDDADDN